jgi:hypothetical protein
MIHFNRLRLADAINVITREVHQHDMLGPIFLRIQQLLAKLFVLCDTV